jgi:hypothetical protein
VPLAAACRAKANSIQPEDVARLSPLVFEHINLLGRLAFSVPESVARGSFDPFAIRPAPRRTSPDVSGSRDLQNSCCLNSVFRSIDPQYPPRCASKSAKDRCSWRTPPPRWDCDVSRLAGGRHPIGPTESR